MYIHVVRDGDNSILVMMMMMITASLRVLVTRISCSTTINSRIKDGIIGIIYNQYCETLIIL